MSSLKTTKNDRAFLRYLHTMVEMTEEASVMKMQKIRQSVLNHRTYMEGLLQIFQHVKQSHERELRKALEKRKNANKLPFFGQKKVAVLLSPSTKFSGTLSLEVFTRFVETVGTNNWEVVVVGDIGKELFERHFGQRKAYHFFAFNTERPDTKVLRELLDHILHFNSIEVFTGRFQSLAVQEAVHTNVSGYTSLAEKAAETVTTKGPEFLFEPSLEEIVRFFDQQVTASLFQQTLDESSLAHLAARIMVLESSVSSIETEAKKVDKKMQLLSRRLRNKKQQQQLSSIRLWS